MGVRDFFDRVIARLAGRAGGSRSSQQPVLNSVAARAAAAEQRLSAAPRHSIGNWLEDGRRLRVRITAAFIAPQEESRRLDVRLQGAERPRVVSSPNRRSGEAPAPLPQTAPLTQPGALVAPSSPTSFGDTPLEEIEAMDAEQRKLIFLGYLVRQGVYNEGFKGPDLPQQYRRSQGRDQDPSAPDADDGASAE
jgi:hypothetical protein